MTLPESAALGTRTTTANLRSTPAGTVGVLEAFDARRPGQALEAHLQGDRLLRPVRRPGAGTAASASDASPVATSASAA